MATLIGTYYYYLYTGDESFLSGIWTKYLTAMLFITSKIDSTGLLDVTGTNDWGRISQGGHNTEANMLMYKALTAGSSLATWMGNSELASNWTLMAAGLKSAVNSPSFNWDTSVGSVSNLCFQASYLTKIGPSKIAIQTPASTPKTATPCPWYSASPTIPTSKASLSNLPQTGDQSAPSVPNSLAISSASLRASKSRATSQLAKQLELLI